MGTYQTAVAGTTITAAWGNNVRDSVVNTFASAAARTSAISSPSESMFTYLTDKHRFEGYDGTQYCPVPYSQTIVKTADEAVTSSTTLQDDDELLLPLTANATYELSLILHYTSQGDLKFGFTFPASTTLTFGVDGYVVGGSFTITRNSVAGASSGVSTLSVAGSIISQVVNVTVTGTLITAGTAGNLRLQWAENTSNATATTVKAGSIMRLTRIS